MLLGEKIKTLRKKLGLLQRHIAQEDFTVSYISQIEKNKIQPSLSALDIIASRLQVSTSYLLENIDDSSRPLNQSASSPEPTGNTLQELVNEILYLQINTADTNAGETLRKIDYLKNKLKNVRLEFFEFICDFYKAKVLFTQKDFETAHNTCIKVVPQLKLNRYYDKLAESYYIIGKYYNVVSNFTEAENYYNLSLNVISDNKLILPQIYFYCKINLAVIWGERNLSLKAYKSFEELAKETQKQELYSDTFLCITNLARAHIDFGNYEDSAHLLQQLLTVYQLLHNDSGLAQVNVCLALIAMKQNNYNEATVKLRHALTFAKAANDVNQLSEIYFFIAKSYLELGELEESMRYCRKMFYILRDKRNSYSVRAYAYNILGEVLKLRNKPLLAIKALQKAEKGYLSLNLLNELPRLYACLGDLYFAVGDITHGQLMYKKSIDCKYNEPHSNIS